MVNNQTTISGSKELNPSEDIIVLKSMRYKYRIQAILYLVISLLSMLDETFTGYNSSIRNFIISTTFLIAYIIKFLSLKDINRTIIHIEKNN